MNTSSNAHRKHLDQSKRIQIEGYLNDGKKFTQISSLISKHKTTISKEIKKNRKLIKCNRYGISKDYDLNCPKTSIPPYVCNNCKSRMGCRKNRYMYYAEDAHKNYLYTLSDSRSGINLDAVEFHLLNKIVKEDISKGHSFSMIVNNHKDQFNVSKRTLYNYQEKGYLDTKNIDLPRKVRYKKRVKNVTTIPKNFKHRQNRSYKDFLTYKEEFFINNGYDIDIVQLDTVEGVKGESVLLTLLFVKSNFLLAFKMEDKTVESVCRVFGDLKDSLQMKLFHETFPVLLTDNGTEFSYPEYIEDNGPYIPKSKVFYCHPNRSDQKGSLEVTHEYIRRFIPKGVSFNKYTPDDILLMINHINSTPRDKYSGASSFEVQELFFGKTFFNELNLIKFNPINVVLNNSIFKNKKDNTK
jgi:Transposase and inactivated derivatives, IS30 family